MKKREALGSTKMCLRRNETFWEVGRELVHGTVWTEGGAVWFVLLRNSQISSPLFTYASTPHKSRFFKSRIPHYVVEVKIRYEFLSKNARKNADAMQSLSLSRKRRMVLAFNESR